MECGYNSFDEVGIVEFDAQKGPSEEGTFKLRPEGSVSHIRVVVVRGKGSGGGES